jgi:hypothetical protein
MFKTVSVGLVLAVTCFTAATVAHADVVTDWNGITLRCVQGVPGSVPANRSGPVGLLDIALIQAAVHDAVQAIEGRYEAYRYSNPSLLGAGSTNAAAASASYRMLSGLYGADDPCLVGVIDPAVTYAGDGGLQAGNEAAAVMLPLYRPTFASPIDPFFGGTEPGQWRPTPNVTMAANTFMAYTEPFTLNSTKQFRPQPPPPMVSEIYTREYNEVKSLGSETGSSRSIAQHDLALFWFTNPISAWFGTLRGISMANMTNVGDSARLFALAGMAAADGQMTVYESKAHYNFWRPITAIWFGDDDGNPDTEGDPTWKPLMQTPPYADHSSGANCLASAILSTVELVLGTDAVNFSISSSTAGLLTNPRQYSSLSSALDDIVDVRILQGIHFRSADIEGRRQGARVAHWAYQRFLRPLAGTR